MAVKIRLTRMGAKKSPTYRVVVTDSKVARSGSFIENVGTYNPMANPAVIDLKKDRIKYWLSVGAQPTDTARDLLFRAKLIEKVKFVAPRPKQMPPAPKSKVEAKEEVKAEEVVAAEPEAIEPVVEAATESVAEEAKAE